MPPLVLVVAADPAAAASWAAVLHAAGYGVRTVTALPQARALLTTHRVAGVLFVAPQPTHTVLACCAELRVLCGAEVVILVVCPPEAAWLRVAALELGADDVVSVPVVAEEVLARLAAHLRRRTSTGTPRPDRVD